MSNASNDSDCVTSAFRPNDQMLLQSPTSAQKIITVPAKLMLNEMLKQLELPMAQYETKVYEDGQTGVTIVFHTSPDSCQPMTGSRSMDAAVAEQNAAVAAIRYIEKETNSVVRDLNYVRLKELEKQNKNLRTQLTAVKGKFKKTKATNNKLAKGWFYSARKMFYFSAQLYNVTLITNFGGKDILGNDIKAALANIYGIAVNLRSKSEDLESKLEEMRQK